MSDTPETDDKTWLHEGRAVISPSFARTLERQRDEARKSAQGLADAMVRYAHQRDAYAETLRQVLVYCNRVTDANQDKIIDSIRERHPELGNADGDARRDMHPKQSDG